MAIPASLKKTRAAEPPLPIVKPAALWKILNEKGRLHPKTHDETFIAHLGKALGIENGLDIAAFLAKEQTDTTTFVIALLSALQPFGWMLRDVYEMFRRHEVNASNERLLIQFDFNRAKTLGSLDLSHFQAGLQSVEALHASVEQRQYVASDLWRIAHQVSTYFKCVHAPDTDGSIIQRFDPDHPFEQWAKRLHSPHPEWIYSSPPPLPAALGKDTLSDALRPLLVVALRLCDLSSLYSDFSEWRHAEHVEKGSWEPGEKIRSLISHWGHRRLCWTQHDHLAETLLRLIWSLFEHAPKDNISRRHLAESISLIIEMNSDSSTVTSTASVLENLLDLPAWKQRSQIYSIWLITVIERALPSESAFRLLTNKGTLRFDFKKTAIAKFVLNSQLLVLGSELRTPSGEQKLSGHGRVNGIQPDYVIARECLCGPVVYVLEAKQYARANTRNFAWALRDYAAIHRLASVALANHGPCSKYIAKRVLALAEHLGDTGLAERTTAFGDVRPTRHIEIAQLQQHLRDALLPEKKPLQRDTPTLIVDVSGSMASVLPNETNFRTATLFSVLFETGMPVLLKAKGQTHEYLDEHIRFIVLHQIFLYVKDTDLMLSELQGSHLSGRTKPVLMTDQEGFEETRSFHDRLAGVIVLSGPNDAVFHINHESHTDLQLLIPNLLSAISAQSIYGKPATLGSS